MYYKAQANVSYKELLIYKNQPITKEVYESLPERLKIKFKVQTDESDIHPAGYNEIVGDTPEEKAKREQLAKEEAAKKAAEEAKKKKN